MSCSTTSGPTISDGTQPGRQKHAGTIRKPERRTDIFISAPFVWRATEAAHATESLARLPQGFDTSLGERGVRLCGGQRRRIVILRAWRRCSAGTRVPWFRRKPAVGNTVGAGYGAG